MCFLWGCAGGGGVVTDRVCNVLFVVFFSIVCVVLVVCAACSLFSEFFFVVLCLSSSFSTWSLPSSLSWASLSSCPLGRCRPARCALSCCSLCSCHFGGFWTLPVAGVTGWLAKTRKADSQHPNVPTVTWAQRGSILSVSVRLPRPSPCPVGAIIASKCPHHEDDRAEHVATAGHRRTPLSQHTVTVLRMSAAVLSVDLAESWPRAVAVDSEPFSSSRKGHS